MTKHDHSKHEKQEHKKTHKVRRHHHRKPQGVNTAWMYLSILLGVLFIASVMTNGFKGNDIGAAINAVDVVLNKADSAELKSSLTDVKSTLIDLQSEMKEVEEEPADPEENAGDNTEDNSGSTNSDTAVLELYVMSQCPYGTQVVDAIAPVKEKLGDSLDLKIEYIFYNQAQYAGKESTYCVDDLCGMHGVPEVNGNIVQLCAMKYNPDNYLDMITCQNQNAGAIPGNWESCADGLDVESIKACYEGEEGKELARESSKNAQEKEATGSPTIFLNDEAYNGGRSEVEFLRAICNSFENRPEGCADVPEPVKVEMTVLNDKTCKTCSTAQINSVSKQLFPGLVIKNVDVSSDEGIELVEKYNLELAPSYLFDMKIEETETWKTNTRITGAFEKLDGMYKLMDSQSGASYYIDEEKRKEALEKPRIALGITDDSMPQMDFFVMSFCPYGIQAESGILPVEETLRGKAKFVPHFVIYSSGTGCREAADGTQYCSLHGANELNEDIRQLCIYEDQEDKFFSYITLIANDYNNRVVSDSNINEKWTEYAEAVGIDVAKVEECYNDEERVLSMLKKEKQLNDDLGVRGSPSVFVNAESYNGGRTPADYQASLCNAFDERPEECGVAQEATAQTEVAAGSCG